MDKSFEMKVDEDDGWGRHKNEDEVIIISIQTLTNL